MLDSHPPLSPGRTIGIALSAILILFDIGILILMFLVPIGVFTVLLGLLFLASLPVNGIFIFVTAGISRARYRVREDTLLIEWGRMVQSVPLSSISEIIPAEAIRQVGEFQGIRWPGCMLGRGSAILEDGREFAATFYATRMVEDQILIVSEQRAYGLSPSDPFAFVASVKASMDSEPKDGEPEPSDTDHLELSIWPERQAMIILGTTIILNLLLFAVLALFYGRLPDEVPLHFDKAGNVDRTGSPSELFILPLIGLVAWIAAAVGGWYFYYLRHEKPVAYIIWGVTAAIQLVIWITTISLVLA